MTSPKQRSTQTRLKTASLVALIGALYLSIIALVPRAVDQRLTELEREAKPSVDALLEREAEDQVPAPSEPLSVVDTITLVAHEHGFADTEYLFALARCESGLNPGAIGDGGSSRGLWQIHQGYHPTITDEQAHDPVWSTAWTIQKLEAGAYRLWTCGRRLGPPSLT
jgi:hypothetical protein